MIRAGARPEESVGLVMALENDREFMRDLREGAVVSSSDPAYATWRDQRAQFDALIGRVFTERFALEPETGGAAWGALRLLTYQFLHGDAAHWLGNMIILLLAGPFAEAALGRFRFLVAFIGSGIFAGALPHTGQRSSTGRRFGFDLGSDGDGGRFIRHPPSARVLLVVRLLQYGADSRAAIAASSGY